VITFCLELDSEGNPKHAPSITDSEGNDLGVDQTASGDIRFEIRQGRDIQVSESPQGQGAILTRILWDWAEARMDQRCSNIQLVFGEDKPDGPITGIGFASWEYLREGFREARTEAEVDALRLGFVVGRSEAAQAIRLLKAGIAGNRKRK
jgi:hypothetical protein